MTAEVVDVLLGLEFIDRKEVVMSRHIRFRYALLTVGLLALLALSAQAADNGPRPGATEQAATALQERFLLEELTATEKELIQVHSDLRKARVELAVQKENLERGVRNVSEAALEEVVEKDPLIQKMSRDVAEAEAHLRSYEQVAKPGDPPGKQLEAKVKSLRESLARRRAEVLEQARAKSREALDAGLSAARDQVEMLTRLEKELQVEVERLQNQVAALSKPTGSANERFDRVEEELRQLRAAVEEMKALLKKGQPKQP